MKNTRLSAAGILMILTVSCSSQTSRDTAPIVLTTHQYAGGEPFPTPLKDTVKMAVVKGGSYVPFYGGKDTTVTVKGFMIDVIPVTNARYLAFVQLNPQWRRSNVKRIYADANYLLAWENDTTLATGTYPDAPVTNISWFAAKAYCDAAGKSLPTVDQWEYAAMADDTTEDARKKESFNRHILSWYEKPNTSGNRTGLTPANIWGIHDLHGLVWEWTADFNEVMLSGESRRDVTSDNGMFCGSGSVGASDLMNYAAFMRFAFRGSLKANYCVQNQGFRAVMKIE